MEWEKTVKWTKTCVKEWENPVQGENTENKRKLEEINDEWSITSQIIVNKKRTMWEKTVKWTETRVKEGKRPRTRGKTGKNRKKWKTWVYENESALQS